MTVRFLHVSDLHLDSPLVGLDRYPGAPAGELRAATREALANLVATAIRERVDFVAVVGDLYDGDWTDFNTGLYFRAQMGQLREAGIPVFVVRGNHDAESQITRRLTQPDNVHEFPSGKPATHTLEHVGAAIHGQSFRTRATVDDLAAGYPDAVPGLLNVGLLHTSLDGRPDHDPYAPTRLEVLRARGYEYWALGHVHAREVVCEQRPRVVYSGNPQGRHARETGAKGGELVEWDGRRLHAQAIALDTVRWAHLSIAADPIGGLSDFQQCCLERLAALAAAADGRLLAVRVSIAGAGALHRIESSQPGQLEAELRAVANELPAGARVWIEKVGCNLRPDYDRARLAANADAIGELLRLIDHMAADDAALAEIGRRALEDLHVKLPGELRGGADALRLLEPELLRGLLPQAESTLIARLLDGLR